MTINFSKISCFPVKKAVLQDISVRERGVLIELSTQIFFLSLSTFEKCHLHRRRSRCRHFTWLSCLSDIFHFNIENFTSKNNISKTSNWFSTKMSLSCLRKSWNFQVILLAGRVNVSTRKTLCIVANPCINRMCVLVLTYNLGYPTNQWGFNLGQN